MLSIVNLFRALPFVLILGGLGYTYHWYEINKLESSIKDLKITAMQCEQVSSALEEGKQRAEQLVAQMQQNNEEQQRRISILQKENQTISVERDEYLSIFKRHDLTNLARAKPGLIEPRINKGTKDVFDDVEKITQDTNNEKSIYNTFHNSTDGVQ